MTVGRASRSVAELGRPAAKIDSDDQRQPDDRGHHAADGCANAVAVECTVGRRAVRQFRVGLTGT